MRLEKGNQYWTDLVFDSKEIDSLEYADRRERKIQRASKPNLEQVVYYFVPLFLLSVTLLFFQAFPAIRDWGDQRNLVTRVGRSA